MGWEHVAEIDAGTLTSRALTPDRLGDLDQVFGEAGVARRCYCMHWRRPDGGYTDSRSNRERFSDCVNRGRAPGLLGYLADDPVGWVQVGPRDEFPTLERSPLLASFDDSDSWSVNCFVTRVGYRRQGVAAGMLAAAMAFARHHGADLVEGYPVDGPRSSSVDYFTGTLGMFQEEGFVEILRRNPTRPMVRRSLNTAE